MPEGDPQNFGGPRSSGRPLAPTDLGADDGPTRLSCQIVGQITPLQAGMSADGERVLPPLARQMLFDGPGSAYALIDSAQVHGLPERLAASGLKYSTLFDGDAAEKFRDASPWLIELQPDSRLTALIFTKGPRPWQMWGRNGGCFIRSDLSLAALRAHFRKYTRIQSQDDNRWLYFRFWESHAIASMARHFVETGRPDLGLFSPAEGAMTLIALPDGRTAERWSLTPPARTGAPRTVVDDGLQSALGRGRQLYQYSRIAERIEERGLHDNQPWPRLLARVNDTCDDLLQSCGIAQVRNLTAICMCLIGLGIGIDEHRDLLSSDAPEDDKVTLLLRRLRGPGAVAGTGTGA